MNPGSLKTQEIEDLTSSSFAFDELLSKLSHNAEALRALCDAHVVLENSEKMRRNRGPLQLPQTCQAFIQHLNQGHRLEKREVLGKGAFGQATKVTIGEDVFVEKKIHSHLFYQSCKDKLMKEASILMSHDHPNIVKLVGVNLTSYVFFMSLGEKNSLYKNTESKEIYKPSSFLRIFIDVAKGLEYLERQEIIHNDLHLGNIVLDENKALITDFDLSAPFGQSYTDAGNLEVMAPEKMAIYMDQWKAFIKVFCKKASFQTFIKDSQDLEDREHPTLKALKKRVSCKIDVWSFGMDLFAMMSGGHSIYEMVGSVEKNYLLSACKFQDTSYLELAHRKFRGQHRFFKIGLDDRCELAKRIRENVLPKCFRVDCDERASIAEVKKDLESLAEEEKLIASFSGLKLV